MGMRHLLATLTAAVLVSLAVPGTASAQDQGTVKALLFYSPQCGHCEAVINDHLPGIFEDHGGAPVAASSEATEFGIPFTLSSNGTFELLLVNVLTDPGAEMYDAASAEFQVPYEMMGVPRLILGDEFWVGSGDIPAVLPGLIEAGVAAGGVDWPAIEGVDAALAGIPLSQETPATTAVTEPSPPSTDADSVPTAVAPVPETSITINPFPTGEGTTGVNGGIGEPLDTVGEKFRSDIVGNSLAVVVLAGMLASLIVVWILVRRGRLSSSPGWLIPLLAAAGVFVAIYLTYVETSGAEAVCGPVGNCNAVQESKFALLFGVVHVGLVGLISYAVVVGAWLGSRLMKAPWSDWAAVALALGTAGGVAFSIYLTFLEPFVIGATCIWCLSSALIVTALFWLTAGPGWAAWQRLRAG
ncbi:MAG: vitamin K epoxide reductase family protein [Acidimicrobiia bacterium]|nr:vitamin K epoxide reductase family protein [Acidimicrobiia bacterium]